MTIHPDIVKLSAEILGLLTPYFALGAGEFAKSVGKEAYAGVHKLFSKLRDYWSDDEKALESLTRFQEQPNAYQVALRDILQDALQNDPQLASDLKLLCEKVAPTVVIDQDFVEADDVVGLEAKRMHSGTAIVTQNIGKAKNIKGVTLDDLG